MDASPTPRELTIQAPAKLNLFLEVLSRREDGFHEIETLMTTITRFDTLSFSTNSENQVQFDCRWATGLQTQTQSPTAAMFKSLWGELPQRENLVVRALELLRRRAGVEQGVSVRLVKTIPAAAGMGGASSDAAAALQAANQWWGIHWPIQKLAALAAEIGSDVPFFFDGQAAICRGRGERIEPLSDFRPIHIVVVCPPAGLATPLVYQHCRPASAAHEISPLLQAARSGDSANIGRLLFNRLQEAAETLSPWIVRLRRAFDRADCWGHRMSGSGTSYFGVCRSRRHARQLAGALRAAGLGEAFACVAPAPFRFRRGGV